MILICDWLGRDWLGQSVKCLKQENWLDMIGRDNISRSDLCVSIENEHGKTPRSAR